MASSLYHLIYNLFSDLLAGRLLAIVSIIVASTMIITEKLKEFKTKKRAHESNTH